MNRSMIKRLIVFILGILIMSFGVTLSVKANLGVSPVSCVPYIYSLSMPLSIGELTILLNIFFILLQMAILRKEYKIVQLVQLPAVIVFGYCIDFTMFILTDLNPTFYIEQFLWCLLSCAALAFGVFLLIKTNLTYLPLDGLVAAISKIYKKEFGKVKICMDSSMVIIGVLSSYVFLNRLEGIGEGSIIAALLIGVLIKFYSTKLARIEKYLR